MDDTLDETVCVWLTWLSCQPTMTPFYLRLLDDVERQRASAFRFPSDRRRFIVTHGVLRTILATHVGCKPEEIRMSRGRQGKPHLDEPHFGDVRFNLAHSGEVAMVVVSHGRDVGVDLEEERSFSALGRMASVILSPVEQDVFVRLHPSERHRALLRAWTRKEAVLKATGTGLFVDPATVPVPLDPTPPLTSPGVFEQRRPEVSWQLWEPVTPSGYLGAVAVQGRASSITCRWWGADSPPVVLCQRT